MNRIVADIMTALDRFPYAKLEGVIRQIKTSRDRLKAALDESGKVQNKTAGEWVTIRQAELALRAHEEAILAMRHASCSATDIFPV